MVKQCFLFLDFLPVVGKVQLVAESETSAIAEVA